MWLVQWHSPPGWHDSKRCTVRRLSFVYSTACSVDQGGHRLAWLEAKDSRNKDVRIFTPSAYATAAACLPTTAPQATTLPLRTLTPGLLHYRSCTRQASGQEPRFRYRCRSDGDEAGKGGAACTGTEALTPPPGTPRGPPPPGQCPAPWPRPLHRSKRGQQGAQGLPTVSPPLALVPGLRQPQKSMRTPGTGCCQMACCGGVRKSGSRRGGWCAALGPRRVPGLLMGPLNRTSRMKCPASVTREVTSHGAGRAGGRPAPHLPPHATPQGSTAHEEPRDGPWPHRPWPIDHGP